MLLTNIPRSEEIRATLASLPTYIRVNTLAIKPAEFKELFPYTLEETAIPFVFRLVDKVAIGSTPEYKAGLIYSQSLSSSLVPLAFSKFTKFDMVFDAGASPGSKTTEMAMLMNNEGAIIANDRKDRHPPLLSNLKRMGVINTIVTSHDLKKIPYKNFFTKILLDAPCSALGSWENAWKRLEEAPNIPKRLSNVQKKAILSSFDALKQGGELVYSTCTITEEENETVIQYLLNNRETAAIQQITLPIKHSKGLDSYNFSSKVARIYPWEVNSEGFFIAKIKKNFS